MRLFAFLLLLLQLQVGLTADVLAEIEARLTKTEITEGHFRQEKNIQVLKKPLISTGTFVYHRKLGVIWQTLTPVPSILLVNQMRILTMQGEQVLPPSFGRVFTAMFGGGLQSMNEGFDISGTNSKVKWQFQMKPKDASLQKVITGMQLTGDKELQEIDISEANGNFTRITFEHITHPVALSPAQEADFDRLSSPR